MSFWFIEGALGNTSWKVILPHLGPMSHYYGMLSPLQFNREMTNVDIMDDDKGDSNYPSTGGDNINYIETSNEWT